MTASAKFLSSAATFVVTMLLLILATIFGVSILATASPYGGGYSPGALPVLAGGSLIGAFIAGILSVVRFLQGMSLLAMSIDYECDEDEVPDDD